MDAVELLRLTKAYGKTLSCFLKDIDERSSTVLMFR